MNTAVMFDLDGVLVDACDWHYKALNLALMHAANYMISEEDHETTYNGLPTLTKLNMLVDKGIIMKDDIEMISNLKQDFTVETINRFCREAPEKIKMLSELKRKGFLLACVTNSITLTASLMLRNSGIYEYFDCIVTNQDVRTPKPHPEAYIQALVRLQVYPEDAFIVEDSPKGLEAARLTGCRVIQVKNAKDVNWSLLENKI